MVPRRLKNLGTEPVDGILDRQATTLERVDQGTALSLTATVLSLRLAARRRVRARAVIRAVAL